MLVKTVRHTTDCSRTPNVLTDNARVHKLNLGAFNTSMFVRSVPTTVKVYLYIGDDKIKTISFKSTQPYYLE